MFNLTEALKNLVVSAMQPNFSVATCTANIGVFAMDGCNGSCTGVCGNCGYCCQLGTKDE